MQNKINVFIFYAECIQLLDFRRKVTKKRVQNKINVFIFYAECIQLLDFRRKVTKKRVQNKINVFIFYTKHNVTYPPPLTNERLGELKFKGENYEKSL